MLCFGVVVVVVGMSSKFGAVVKLYYYVLNCYAYSGMLFGMLPSVKNGCYNISDTVNLFLGSSTIMLLMKFFAELGISSSSFSIYYQNLLENYTHNSLSFCKLSSLS